MDALVVREKTRYDTYLALHVQCITIHKHIGSVHSWLYYAHTSASHSVDQLQQGEYYIEAVCNGDGSASKVLEFARRRKKTSFTVHTRSKKINHPQEDTDTSSQYVAPCVTYI